MGPLSRRAFLRAAGAAGVGSLLLRPRVAGAAKAGKEGKAAPEKAPAIPLRVFGRTGVEVPVLSFGAAIDLTENRLILSQCMKRGVTYWDTADGYAKGKAETGIGEHFAANPGDRKKVFLVTKTGVKDPAGMDRALARSLEKMKTDWVDLYFFHGVDDIKDVDNAGLRDWAEKAKKAGKIRAIGLSTHKRMAPVMEGVARLGWMDGLMTTYNYRIMQDDDMKRAVDACAKAGVGVTAMKTQGGGPIKDTPADRELAGHFVAKGLTPEQAKIRAVLEDGRVASACLSMATVDLLKANVAAVSGGSKPDASDRRALERHAAATCGTACAACGRCERAMAGTVPVPDVIRFLMYARDQGDPGRARELYRELGAAVRRRVATADFSRAERACPRGLPVGMLMREADIELA